MKKSFLNFLVVSTIFLTSNVFSQSHDKNTKKSHLISFSHQGESVDISEGRWSTSKGYDNVTINLTNAKRSSNPFKKNSFFISFYLSDAEASQIEQEPNSFRITREAGTLECTGTFANEDASGDYVFNTSKEFRTFLSNQGIRGVETIDLFKLFLGDVNKSYVLELKKLGYQPNIKQLTKMGLLYIDTDYVQSINETRFKGLDLDMLIKFAIHGVSKKYINDLASLGYNDLDANMVKKWAIHGITSKYIKSLNEAGYKNMDANMVKNFAIHGISSKYVEGLNDLGYKNLEPNVIKNFAIHGISTKYIKSLLDSDIDRPTTSELRKAAIHGVSARFIEKAKNKGHDYDNLSAYTKLSIKGY